MKLCSIASGSKGNAIFVSDEETRLLVDAGISKKRIEEGLEQLGTSASELDGILITHEHSDHVKGLGVMSRKYHLPVYATRETMVQILENPSIKGMEEELFVEVIPERSFRIKTMNIDPFSVYHDAANPVAYRFQSGDKSVGILTDCGTYDEGILEHVKGVNGLLLEANHDVAMLRAGNYPYRLKQRILSDRGHFSNATCGRLLTEVLDSELKQVMLGHLSSENNFAQLAYETVRSEIELSDCPYGMEDLHLTVAQRDGLSEIMTV